jgi:diguanylate cyclase (GGDEF)-like protein
LTESDLGKDLSDTPNVRRFIQERSGTFIGTAAIDGVQRLYTFNHIDSLPLILSVSLSTEDVFAAWNKKAFIIALVTVILCCAVVRLAGLFQRELRRRLRAETKLYQMARTDDLTGLPNRRAFRETLEREWRQAIRSGSLLSLLYIDVDFFETFNDRYGHGKGDEVLQALATVLDANIRRPRDIAARHGGEEFAVILPETDETGARLIAETLRRAVIALGYPHERSPHGVVTISIGAVTVQPPRGSAIASLMQAADKGLYKAKAAGRNQLCVQKYDNNQSASPAN